MCWCGHLCSNNRDNYQESNDETRKRIAEDLKESTTKYANHAEDEISKLQQAYLKKYHPQQYARSTEVSHRPEDVRTKKFKVSVLFRSRREDLRESEPAKPSKSEEGIADIMCFDLVD